MLAITDIINTMQLVYRLLLHSVGHRMRLLSIDKRFEVDAKFCVALLDEQELTRKVRKSYSNGLP